MKWIVGIVNNLAVLAILICAAIFLPTFHLGFYSMEYDKYNIPAQISVPKDELMTVTGELLSYMKGDREDLVIYATVDNQYREFFNDREKAHMVDVKDLFAVGFYIRNIALLAFLLSIFLLLFLKIHPWPVIIRTGRIIIAGFLILAFTLFAIIALDFDKAFTVFHELFFNNDLWILNPNTDLLVNIVPTGFFVDIAALVGIIFVSLSLVTIGGCTLYLRYKRRKSPEGSV